MFNPDKAGRTVETCMRALHTYGSRGFHSVTPQEHPTMRTDNDKQRQYCESAWENMALFERTQTLESVLGIANYCACGTAEISNLFQLQPRATLDS